MLLRKEEVQKLLQVSKLDKNIKKEWLNKYRIYNRNQPLTGELKEALEQFKREIKHSIEENIDIVVYDIYIYEGKTFYIYFLFPIGWNGEYGAETRRNIKRFIGYNPDDFKFYLAINNKVSLDLREGLSTHIESIEDYIYSLSKEAGKLLNSIKEKEEIEKRKNRNKKHIWKLEQLITQRKILNKPPLEMGIVYYLENESYGFIVNLNGEEFYFKMNESNNVNLEIQRFSLVEFVPKKRHGKLFAEEVKVIIENVYALGENPSPNQYRRFGKGKRQKRKGHGGTLDNPWRAF